MVSRAAKLCGMNTVLSDVEVENVLTRFLDCDEVSDWAAVEVAFCRGSGIWGEKDEYIQPLRPALRGEIAQMLYNMLGASRLL